MFGSILEAAELYAKARCLQTASVHEYNIDTAIYKFEKAKKLYTDFLSVQPTNSQCICELADVSSNLTSLYVLKCKCQPTAVNCDAVLQKARECIELWPTYDGSCINHTKVEDMNKYVPFLLHQGHYYYAEGSRMKGDVDVAFKHYNMCYELMGSDRSRNVERRRECFLHLVALGIQCGQLNELPDVYECDQNAICNALLGHLIASARFPYNKELRTKCLQYLLLKKDGILGSGLATRLPCDASAFQLTQLCEKIYPTLGVISALKSKHMVIRSDDIREVVQFLSNNLTSAEALVFLCNYCHCQPEMLEFLYKTVLRQKKRVLAVALIHCGAKVSTVPEKLLAKLEYSELKLEYVASLAKLCTSSQRTDMLTELLSSAQDQELIRELMKFSYRKVRLPKNAPEVLAEFDSELLDEFFKKLPLKEHLEKQLEKCKQQVSSDRAVDILCILLRHGEDVAHEEIVHVANAQLVKKEKIEKLACVCTKELRSKVFSGLLETGNEDAIHIFLHSGKIKLKKLNPDKMAVRLFTSPNYDLLSDLLDRFTPCGPRKECYFKAIQNSGCSDEVKANLYCLLLKKKASVQFLRPDKPKEAIHEATELALKTGNVELLTFACSLSESHPCVDHLGQTPLHLAMKHREDDTSMQVCEILTNANFEIDPLEKDKYGRVAADYANHSEDKRLAFLKVQKSNSEAPTVPKPSTVQEHVGTNESKSAIVTEQASNKDKYEPASSGQAGRKKLKSANFTEQASNEDKNEPASTDQVDTLQQTPEQWKSLLCEVVHKKDDYFFQAQPSLQTNPSRQLSEEDNEPFQHPALQEDIYDEGSADEEDEEGEWPWEVECTEKVLKFLKNKRYPHHFRDAAMKKIKRLGYEHSPSLSDPVGDRLYKAKLTPSARILWGIDIQFSERCTKQANKNRTGAPVYVYTEVVRVWDIVLDHDALHQSIHFVLKTKQQEKRANVIYRFSSSHETKPTRDNKPREYVLHMQTDSVDAKTIPLEKFVPAASIREDEYNLLHFYPVSTTFISSMLKGEDARRDFPFKEWPKEHDIITLPQDSPILLIGRSGTGKTTCCLYRLWNEFRMYWEKASEEGPLCLKKPPLVVEKAEEEQQTKEPIHEHKQCEEAISCDTVTSPNAKTHASSIDKEFEHLHQIFVTKNFVLCHFVKKKFYDMCASYEMLRKHLPFEHKPLPNNLVSVEDHGYPLFLTSREFLIVLDNSINDKKQFFPRNKDGSLLVTIHSSDYGSNQRNHSFVGARVEHNSDGKASVCSNEWQEVTAIYFAKKIWPKIGHKYSQKKSTDPLLVWTEIKSFIKGSAEAIQSSKGYLTLEMYEKMIGGKMAPNFKTERKEIYTLFEEYQHYRRKHYIHLFDECDLLHSIYQRLIKTSCTLPWSIHHFYIDEVQDFTQAELLVILQCCRDPNGMFLTGDTAQSIMRGVSFRFKDLFSLFHNAKERAMKESSICKVTVPTKVHKLDINFRSHSGILKLAASVIHLLGRLFPLSFDKLHEDTGLYPGPEPILLVSCKDKSLAHLLSKKEESSSSSMKFGARQVIIVQTDAAKESLPAALSALSDITLTVFQAKGLEFDDVLLYNFFCDSHVTNEWRVVDVSKYAQAKVDLLQDQHVSKPRPLEFDEKRHKSLNAELKYLYTAITRAKCNLWIYDENQEKRNPMFYYWMVRGLARLVKIGASNEDDQNLFKAKPSTPDEWEEQGNKYKAHQLWKEAATSYRNANIPHLKKEAEAYMLAQQADETEAGKDRLYIRAAECFLTSDKHEHNVELLKEASRCLRNAKKYNEAVLLFKRLGMFVEAIDCLVCSNQITEAGCLCETVGKVSEARKFYKQAKEYSKLSQLLEKEKEFDEAVAVWDRAGNRLEALKKAKELETQGQTLDSRLCTVELASKYAKAILHQKKLQNRELVEVVNYLPVELRGKCLKQVGLEEAIEVSIGSGQNKQEEMSGQDLSEEEMKRSKKIGGKKLASLEKDQKFSEAIEHLYGAGKKFEALKKAEEYERRGFTLNSSLCTRELASRYFEDFTSQRKTQNKELTEVTKYLPVELCLKYLKQAGLFDEAVDVHINAKQLKQAERVMSAQGLCKKAIKLSRKNGDKKMEALFRFRQVLSSMILELPENNEAVQEALVDVLKCDFLEQKFKAQTYLLLAKITQDSSRANSAIKAFKTCKCVAGEIESYLQLLRCGQNLLKRTVDIINSCSQVRQVTVSLSSTTKTISDERNINEVLLFYHLYKEGKDYALSKHQNVWLKELASHYSSCTDEDGMVKLQPKVVYKVVADHMEKVMKDVITKSGVNREVAERINRYRFHISVRDKHFLQESFVATYPSHDLRRYILTIEQVLTIRALYPELMQENPSTKYLTDLLSPLVSWFLPFDKIHYQTIIHCKHISQILKNEAKRVIGEVISTPAKSPPVDSLLNTWRTCSILGLTNELSNALGHGTKQYYAMSEKEIPYHLIDKRKQEGILYHVFQYWLRSCAMVCNGQNVTFAAQLMYNFLTVIARRKSLHISVMNFVDIATVCTIGLIATISLNTNCAYHLLMPRFYEHVAKLFDNFNACTSDGRSQWLQTCSTEVSLSKRQMERKCCDLLFNLLKLTLGFYNQRFNVLKYSLSKNEKDCSALYCLELSVVLVANLSVVSPHRGKELDECYGRIYHELDKVVHSGNVSQANYIAEAHKKLGNAGNVGELFDLSQSLLKVHSHDTSLCIINYKQVKQSRNKRVMFADARTPLHFYKEITFQPLVASASLARPINTSIEAKTELQASPLSHRVPIIPPPISAEPVALQAPPVPASADGIQENSHTLQQQQELGPAPDTVYTRQPSTEETEEVAGEGELDEDIARIMKEGVQAAQQVTENPTKDIAEFIDRSIIDEKFCGICGENLQEKQPALPAIIIDDDLEEPPTSPSEELSTGPLDSPPGQVVLQTLEEHLKSSHHKEKETAYTQFSEFKSRQYTPLKQTMEELFNQLPSTELLLTSDQESVFEICRAFLSETENKLEEFQSKAQTPKWREATEFLNSEFEKMNSLCGQLDRTVEDIQKAKETAEISAEENNEESRDAEDKEEEEEEEEKDKEEEEEEEEDEEDEQKEDEEDILQEGAERLIQKRQKGKKQ